MRDINTNQEQYWNWILSSWTYNWYSEVVNFDIVAPTYTHNRGKLRPTSFYYKKRKWYIDQMPYISNSEWDVSDVIRLNEWNCNEEECREYIMLRNKNSWKLKVITRSCWCWSSKDLCWNSWIEDNEDCEDCLCSCWYDKFFVTDFVKWTPRALNDVSFVYQLNTWIQENTNNWTVWIFYDTVNKYFPYTVVWDWIYVSWSPNNEWSAVCWQARQVVSIDYSNIDRDYDILTLNAPREWLWISSIDSLNESLDRLNDARINLKNKILWWDADEIIKAKNKLDWLLSLYNLEKSIWSVVNNQVWIDATYSIFPEWWEVVSYATCDWIKTIHALHRDRDSITWEPDENFIAYTTVACSWFNSDTCIYWINEFNSRINMLWSSWYNIYWWLSYNKFMFSSDNTNYVWTDKVSQAVFRNFLVSFSEYSISVVVYDSAWNAFSYNLDNSIWLFSKRSYTVFQNSLYIIWNDKRLYSCDIISQWQWAWYQLNLTDQSQQVRWELDLLNYWDDVYLYNEWNKMYIFINNKYNKTDTNNSKTKILIYNRDYNRWVTHNICNFIITWKSLWYYIGNSLYWYFWIRDHDSRYSKDKLQWDYFEAHIDAFIWENEDWSNWKMNTLSIKSPKWAKILLWKWIYTDWSTRFIVDYWTHWRQQQYQVDTVEHIDWIRNNNIIMSWWTVEPDDCALSLLAECSNIFRECSNSSNKENSITQWRYCYPEDEIFNDNCVCIDDKAFALSDIYNVFIKLDHLKSSELFKIRIISSWWDSMIFWWMMVSMISNDISVHDVDSEDVINSWEDCCSEWKYIDFNNKCNC